ncbi:MAG: hypothetical protein KAU03_00745 [Candidatus Altiarchaeales archaeon]|nr:hypothetical protein [Candidatus Altiarchaeales archaeon]
MINSKTPFILHEPWFNAPKGSLHYYPPLFHWILVLFSLGGTLDMRQLAVLFQIIFYPLALLTTYHLVSYVENKETGFIAVVVLTSYFPFFGRTHLPIPEALQHILIPLAFLTYLKSKDKLCGIILAMLLMNHIYDSLLILSAIFTHWFVYRRESFNMRNLLLISSLGLIFQLHGIYGHMYIHHNQPWLTNPLPGISYRSYLAVASSSIMLILGSCCILRKSLSKSNNIFIFWFLFTLPIFWKMTHRFPAYAGAPLAVLAAILIVKLKNEGKNFYGVYLPIIVGLLVANACISYLAFPHIHDFYKPGVDENEKLALLWIKQNIPAEQIIQLGPRRSFYDGYRIAYFTGHKTTESENIAGYLYCVHPVEPPGNWTLIKGYGLYRIYTKA